ncbi:MAG: hypothetical protein H7328_00880 [Bdellovibrio sp.]|nr:hypothetical protein [Bdellovibrio sp.]
MKKTFNITGTTHKPDRQVELVKHEINKYLARERRKAVPAGADFWDFACKCGANSNSATAILVTEFSKKVDEVAANKPDTIYVEIIAKPGTREKKSSD